MEYYVSCAYEGCTLTYYKFASKEQRDKWLMLRLDDRDFIRLMEYSFVRSSENCTWELGGPQFIDMSEWTVDDDSEMEMMMMEEE